MCCVVTITLAALLVLPLALAQLPSYELPNREVFLDAPLSDYSNRTTLRDCPQRFYPSRIIYSYRLGGSIPTFRGEFLHMVAIGWTSSTRKINYLCRGTLLTDVFVLTAAHCSADEKNLAPDTVRIGDTDLESPEDDRFVQKIAIERITTHPDYRSSLGYFDIAIIQLKHAANFEIGACNACLWREEDVPVEQMTAIGFGPTGFFQKPTLLRVELDSIDLSDCAKRIPALGRKLPWGIQKHQFCAAGNGMDTCEGYSGGPLDVKRSDFSGYEIPLVVGVVSFGTPCNGSTGVYTRVSAFLDWIEQMTNTSFGYLECQKLSSSCGHRSRLEIPEYFVRELQIRSRYGLVWDDEQNFSLHECGATAIDYQYFITTASCVTSYKGHPKYVTFDGEQLAAITDVYVSPKFRAGRPENNIALIKIAKFINTKEYPLVCLWNKNIDGEWGNKFLSAYKSSLRHNDSIFLNISESFFVTEGCETAKTSPSDVVCYSSRLKMLPGVCTMDQGGPALSGITGTVHAYGVISSLSKGCESNVYISDVTPHIDWIESIIVHKRDKFLLFSN